MGIRGAAVLSLLVVLPGLLPADDPGLLKAVRTARAAVPAGAYRGGQVIVAFRAAADERDVERALRSGGARQARRSLSRSAARFLVTLDPESSVLEAVARYSRMPEVEYAEPNGLVRRLQGATFKPNDTLYRYQWNLTQVGAERTWGIQKGKPSVAVAVLDSGVAYEDYIDPRTGQNFRKAPDWGDVKFLPGYDFVNGDTHPNDDEYHGTHVASTIAEATNNATGAAGLAFGCALMPVKVLDDHGDGTFFDVAEGIDYAAEYTEGGEKPVKVINLSLGSPGTSQTVRSAVERAWAAGVLTVAAAGNSGSAFVEFPANLPNVLAVGALDARKGRASYSNTGAELDFVAPGGDCDRDDNADGYGDCVYQQMPDPDFLEIDRHDAFCYCGLDGTSMATPHVAAAAALLFSQGFTDPAAVRAALEQTAERLGGAPADGRNDTYGHGLVRPADALPGLGFATGPKK
ncbi:MAG TPA: S8 family peptidase [Vicinamibacteria bacterium]|nr:S8 family peptidase [Vicinamibacteria bacterium]